MHVSSKLLREDVAILWFQSLFALNYATRTRFLKWSWFTWSYMVYHTNPHKNNLNDVNKSEYYANMCIVSFWKNNFHKFYFNQGINIMKFTVYTLAGRVSWLEHCPVDQRVAGLIPSQDTYLGCRLYPSLGHMQGRTANWHSLWHQCFSLSLSLSVSPSSPPTPTLSPLSLLLSLPFSLSKSQ